MSVLALLAIKINSLSSNTNIITPGYDDHRAGPPRPTARFRPDVRAAATIARSDNTTCSGEEIEADRCAGRDNKNSAAIAVA
jgi:hypothetical protein